MSDIKIVNFMGLRHFATMLSIVMVLVSIGSLATRGLNFGLDFTGGVAIELEYAEAADLPAVRQALRDAGYPGAVVASFGTDRDVAVRIQSEDNALGEQIVELLRDAAQADIKLKSSSYVGPQIGEELRDDGGLGLLFALIVVMAYVAVRFQYKFSIGAVVALMHDVLITLGVFSVTQLNFDLTVLAALLAVIGYSLNDTIVVFDRIRENFRVVRKADSTENINISLTQTLGRTLMTSLTTLLVLLALFIVGGEVIHNFSIALIWGVIIGTYSSIFVAANVLLYMHISKDDLIEVEKEGADQEEISL